MIDSLIRWSLRNRAIVLAFAAAFLVWGGYTIARHAGGRAAGSDRADRDDSRRRARDGPDRDGVAGDVSHRVRSERRGGCAACSIRHRCGVAVVWVEFDWGQDIQRARQIVTEKLTTVAGSLPPEVSKRRYLAPVSSIMGEILFIALESDKHSPLELRTIAETVVRRRLLAVPGVSQVIATGGGQKQYQVLVDRAAACASYNVTLKDVETALKAGNRNSSAGFMVAGGQEYLIQGVGACQDGGRYRQRRDHERRHPAGAGPRRCRSAGRSCPEARRGLA